MFYSCFVLSSSDGSNGISDYLDSRMDCISLHRKFEEAAWTNSMALNLQSEDFDFKSHPDR